MSDRCSSTVLCSVGNQEVFQRLGYRRQEAEALTFEGNEIAGAVLMTDDEAVGGHYDDLTSMKGIPFVASNTACPGVWGDHLIASDGHECVYVETLAESNYPAVRVNPDGEVLPADLVTARSYWQVYNRALRVFEERARHSTSARGGKQ
ncbi:MAG TPA: hypothetical protein VGX94_01765 [Terriglobia bacterium]|nr:hypothetical protein [Terriglobia bacterium]